MTRDVLANYIDKLRYIESDTKITAQISGEFYTKPRNTLKFRKVIFNPPATIIFWNDNTKTVVKCQPSEVFDLEKGFVMAYLKKLLGNDNTFNKEIKKFMPDDYCY